MSSTDIKKNYCTSCNKSTKHTVIKKYNEDLSYEDFDFSIYHFEKDYYILKCNGCDNVSFRIDSIDYEDIMQVGPDEYRPRIVTENYPKYIRNHHELDGSNFVPTLVKKAYKDTLNALKYEAKILAGLGLRAVIEAICNDKKITGRNLEIRINKLANEGMISKNDAKRLHAIRFMGNDAAHEILEPSKDSLNVALTIIEHLIQNVYILDKKLDGKLDILIDSYDEFKTVLNNQLKSVTDRNERSLTTILGKHKRRIQKLDEFEDQLKDEINSNNFSDLELGTVQNTDNKEMQMYIISQDIIDQNSSFDDLDFPF